MWQLNLDKVIKANHYHFKGNKPENRADVIAVLAGLNVIAKIAVMATIDLKVSFANCL